MMLNISGMDPDTFMERMISQADETVMPLPSIDSEPHMLISKVRKQYLEYIIRLLSLNSERLKNVPGNNTHLSNAILRCATVIEIDAARSCMLVDFYRRNILVVVKELKAATKQGKLHKKLLEYWQTPLNTNKRTQTTFDNSDISSCTCACTCNGGVKRRKIYSINTNSNLPDNNQFTLQSSKKEVNGFEKKISEAVIPNTLEVQNKPCNNLTVLTDSSGIFNQLDKVAVDILNNSKLSQSQNNQPNKLMNIANKRQSVESQDMVEDEISQKLEQLFRTDSNDMEDFLFEGILCDNNDATHCDTENTKLNDVDNIVSILKDNSNEIVDIHAEKIKSLDERLALLEATGPSMKENEIQTVKKVSKQTRLPNKWHCELYFQKVKLYEMLDETRDRNRKKHARIKNKFLDLFGEDSDDDQVMSPMNETADFVLSCKERIAPWVVKLLTPYYKKGRIKDKALFKGLAKHLLNLIYQCRKYPNEFEVNSFVRDFLRSRRVIMCEADYKTFRIENI